MEYIIIKTVLHGLAGNCRKNVVEENVVELSRKRCREKRCRENNDPAIRSRWTVVKYHSPENRSREPLLFLTKSVSTKSVSTKKQLDGVFLDPFFQVYSSLQLAGRFIIFESSDIFN
jgi:hypothetical protein